jgi:hypothetical protein
VRLVGFEDHHAHDGLVIAGVICCRWAHGGLRVGNLELDVEW